MVVRVGSADTKHRLSDWFRLWHSPLRKFLLGKMGVRAADADDVAQEVFLRLMRYDKADLIEHPQAYIFKMASNVAAEWALRAHARRPHDPKWLQPLESSEQPESDAIRADLQREIERAVAGLSARQREVLRLFYAEGLAQADIASTLHETPRAVRRQLASSYEKLRHTLSDDNRASAPLGKHGRL